MAALGKIEPKATKDACALKFSIDISYSSKHPMTFLASVCDNDNWRLWRMDVEQAHVIPWNTKYVTFRDLRMKVSPHQKPWWPCTAHLHALWIRACCCSMKLCYWSADRKQTQIKNLFLHTFHQKLSVAKICKNLFNSRPYLVWWSLPAAGTCR